MCWLNDSRDAWKPSSRELAAQTASGELLCVEALRIVRGSPWPS